jgi:hypothetical protein
MPSTRRRIPEGKRRKRPEDRKEDQIRVLMTAEEKTRLERAAKGVGLAVASWLRSVGLREAAKWESEK